MGEVIIFKKPEPVDKPEDLTTESESYVFDEAIKLNLAKKDKLAKERNTHNESLRRNWRLHKRKP